MNKNTVLGLVVLAVLIAGAMMYRNPSPAEDLIGETATTTPVVQVTAPKVTKPKTTTVKGPTTTSAPAPLAPAPQIPPKTADGTIIISYTNSGFSPASLTVRPGTSVQFVNKSDKAMRVFTDNPDSRFFRELSQGKTVGKGGTFNFTFLYVGTWNYHNENNISDKGSVVVE